tara:strand:+ start:1261 stop:2106 length:846 start_codon:yes stop_codon:yes gene_type:complete
MDTSRDDFGIAIRSAFLRKGTQQRFSLFILAVISVLLIFLETIDAKPLNAARSFVKDMIYRGSLLVSYPSEIISDTYSFTNKHINLYKNYDKLIEENKELKNNISKSEFLEMENTQLRKLIDEPSVLVSNLVSARVIFDKQSPYLNSFVINTGNNKGIKNGMAVLDGENFIGRVVDVNFFSSRVLLVSDLNSKIPVITEPTGNHAILSGHGSKETTLEYLPENHEIKNGDKVYTSGQEGIFLPGIPIGKIKLNKDIVEVILFSNLKQITFVNVNIEEMEKN